MSLKFIVMKLVKTKTILDYFFYKMHRNMIKKTYYQKKIDNKEKRMTLKQLRKLEKVEKRKYYKIANINDNPVWFCWLQGLENAPELVKVCYKRATEVFPNVILIDENNLFEYINLPENIYLKYKKNIINNAHFSDLIRLELLNRYGGLWIDATVYIRNDTFYEKYCKGYELFIPSNDFNDPNDLSKISNWLIYSVSNNEVLENLEDILLTYWKEHDFVLSYFIFHLVYNQCLNDNTLFFSPPNNAAFLLQKSIMMDTCTSDLIKYILDMSDFHKLNYRLNHDNFLDFLNHKI